MCAGNELRCGADAGWRRFGRNLLAFLRRFDRCKKHAELVGQFIGPLRAQSKAGDFALRWGATCCEALDQQSFPLSHPSNSGSTTATPATLTSVSPFPWLRGIGDEAVL